MLIYLNERWDAASGGNLELFDPTGKTVVTRVHPLLNRCVIAEVHDEAFHGYQPLRLPSDLPRRSCSVF